MSADWYCKIGERKIGPLNGQQLKTVVSKGQLKPEHLVRRGSEGPWVPTGRIKGLFKDGPAGGSQSPAKKLPKAMAKPLGKTTGKPSGPPKAKATNLPTAAEAPAPPVAEVPQEFALGGHDKRHAKLDVESLDYETAPVPASRRKVKAGMKGLKKTEQKKLTVILLCLIGGGLTIGLGVFIWAVATNQFGKQKATAEPEDAKAAIAAAEPANSSAKAKEKTEKKPASPPPEIENWKDANIAETQVGNVVLKVLKTTRGAPPKGAKAAEGEVLIVPVYLQLKEGATKAVDLTSWADASLKKKVSLTDDQKVSYELLDQVAGPGGESKSITAKRIQVLLIFQAPTNAKVKELRLKLPPAAFHGEGPMICYKIDASEIKSAEPDKAAKPE